MNKANLFRTVTATILVWSGVVCFYVYAVPVPMDGLGQCLPKPTALANLKMFSCGVSTTNSSSVSKFYNSARVDSKIRLVVEDEMSAMPGYVRSEDRYAVTFRKKLGGFMPVTSYVRVSTSGSITVGAERRKWR